MGIAKTQVEQILERIIKKYGEEIFDDHRRFENAVRDQGFGYDQAMYPLMLTQLARANAYRRIKALCEKNTINLFDKHLEISHLVSYLVNNAGFDKNNAQEAVLGWFDYFCDNKVVVDDTQLQNIVATEKLTPPVQLRIIYRDNPNGTIAYNVMWKPSQNPEVGYIVRRKYSGSILDSLDGDFLACTLENEYLDTTVELGKAPHYAIYSYKNGKISRRASAIAGTVQLPEVDSLAIKKSTDGRIEIRFRMPKGVHDVQIFRAYGNLATPGNGVPIKLEANSRGLAYDETAESGKQLDYVVYCIFKNKRSGSIIRSRGVHGQIFNN
jgi:hypothetical protein